MNKDYDFDDDLLEEVAQDGMPRVRVYRPERLQVVLGRGSKPDMELQLDACLEDGVALLKRRGGGCSVVLDEGNVIVSAVLAMKGLGRHFDRLSGWLIAGLEEAGIEGVRKKGISDLAVKDRKVGGACIYRSKHVLYYSVTLLVRPDMDRVERYLKHPPREPDYRQGRSHRDFMGALAPDRWPGTPEDLARALRKTLRPGSAQIALTSP